VEPGSDSPSTSDPGSDALGRTGQRLIELLHKDLEGELQTVVAGRYRLGERLGHGAHGQVHRAVDALTGEAVAVKLLPPLIETDLVQLRGEIAALRLLRLPGVAHLFDEGVHHGRPFLVMELVEGAPFPGTLPEGATRWSWDVLREPTLRLLDTLGRVHAAGLVHRDLKPRNVLVTAAGRPVLLDFGLSVGRALADDSVLDSRALGTPAYAAPEQCRGEPVDARADLYALGVMLWEALAGRRPHAAPRVSGIIRERLGSVAEPVERYAPDVPRDVSELLGQLLEVDRDRRPRSAVEVAEALRGQLPAGHEVGPWVYVGRDGVLARLLAAARAGQPCLVCGPVGSGRTRLLREAAACLASEGREVAWCQPASRPFESLGALTKWLAGADPESLSDARRATLAAVRAALDQGVVLVADDLEQLDTWSREVLEKEGERGAVLASVEALLPGSALAGRAERIELSPLQEADLRGLFAGSDRLLHVHEDAARELWERTAGWPAAVDAELAAWTQAGLVEPVGARLAITRGAVDRLRGGLNVLPVPRSSYQPASELEGDVDELLAWVHLAWPNTGRDHLAMVSRRLAWLLDAELETLARAGAVRQLPDGRVRPLRPSRRIADAAWLESAKLDAHARLAAALPEGTPGRLYHLVAAAEHEGAAREAIAMGSALAREGRLGDAEAALAEGLHAARRLPADVLPERERDILRAWLLVVMGDVSATACDRLLYEMSRSARGDPQLLQAERLLRAQIAAYEVDGRRALAIVDSIAPMADLPLERMRQAMRVQAARSCPLADEQRVVDEACRWAKANVDDGNHASGDEWGGRLCYREGRFRDAATAQMRAAQVAPTVTGRLSALLNAASSMLEALDLEHCRAVAGRARDLARSCRHPLFEGRADWLMRAACYRAGVEQVPDVELVDALERVGSGAQAALAALTEAAIAWRLGDQALTIELADRAARNWTGNNKMSGIVLARALKAAATRGLVDQGIEPDELEPLCRQAISLARAEPVLGAQALALLSTAGAVIPDEGRRLMASLRADPSLAGRGEQRQVLTPDEIFAALEPPTG